MSVYPIVRLPRLGVFYTINIGVLKSVEGLGIATEATLPLMTKGSWDLLPGEARRHQKIVLRVAGIPQRIAFERVFPLLTAQALSHRLRQPIYIQFLKCDELLRLLDRPYKKLLLPVTLVDVPALGSPGPREERQSLCWRPRRHVVQLLFRQLSPRFL